MGARRRLASGALIGFAFCLEGLPARAQASRPTEEELVITGSRLSAPNAASSRVTIPEEDVQRAGALTLETLLNTLPQMVASSSTASNNPSANGAAYLDLRGLGEGRTLVLIDGRRVVGGNASNSVDLNTIPPALVDRIEVVTGGASAVYGADAVAGVVNVRLKDDFTGWQAQGRSLVSAKGDGREHDLAIVGGRSFDRGGISGSAGWSAREEVGKGERAFSANAQTSTPFIPGGSWVPGVTLPSQATVNTVFGRYGTPPGAVSNRGGFAGFGFNPDGTLFGTGVPGLPQFEVQNYRGPQSDVVASQFPDVFAYNFEPFNKLILPLDRVSASLGGHVEPTASLSFKALALFTRYDAATALAPSPAPTDPNPLYPGAQVQGFTIPVSNPFIPADLRALLASRTGNAPALAGAGPTEEFLYRFRTSALGARQSNNTAEVVQLLTSANFDIAPGWRASFDISAGRYDRQEQQGGLLSVRRFEQLLDSPTGGTEFCEGGHNPFGQTISASCRAFLTVSARYNTRVEQESFTATLKGRWGELRGGPIEALFGAEQRNVRFRFDPPLGLTPGEVAGYFPVLGVRGAVRAQDLFTEARAPLTERFDVVLGYRASDDRDSGLSHSVKSDLSWRPLDGLLLNVAAQRAVRAPDIFERFQPPRTSFAQARDPCAVASPLRTAQVLDLCRRQAAALGFAPTVTDTFQQFEATVSTSTSGNRMLDPETANTIVLALVWEPEVSPYTQVRLGLDWRRIEIQNAIGYRDAQILINACYNIDGATNPGFDAAAPACTALPRSGADFTLGPIPTPQANQAEILTSGLDMSAALTTDLADLSGRAVWGTLHSNLMVSWLDRFEEQTSPLQRRIDYAGTIAGATVGYQSLPEWKARLTLAWTTGPIEIGVAGRYIDAMSHRTKKIDPTALATGVKPASYWDLSARWRLRRGLEARASVQNLLDRGPELYSPAVDANTEPSTYDVIGRRFWLALTWRS